VRQSSIGNDSQTQFLILRIPKREALSASEEAWLMHAKCEFASLVLRKCMAPLLAFREGGFQVIISMIDLYSISFQMILV
jgi:hypothetical protein